MPADEVARLRAKADGPAYDVVTWTGACPEEYLAAYCAMQTRMSVDLPTGEVDVNPSSSTPRGCAPGRSGP